VQTLLRWAVRAVLGLLGILAWETTYAGIPENISKQVAFVQALGGEFLLRYVELPLLGFVLFVLAIGPTRVKRSAEEVVDWVKKRPESDQARRPETQQQVTPVNEDLRQRCCELSAEIRKFYRRQKEDFDKRLKSDLRTVFLLEEPHRSQWRAEETERHEKAMVERYSEELGGVVSALCDDLEPHGLCILEQRNRFENPTGPQDIRYTAQRLEAICAAGPS
jgi:hypothetical protein